MIKNLMNKFVKEQEGGLAEYAIVLGIVALVAIVITPLLKTTMSKFEACMEDRGLEAFNESATPTACS